MVNIRALLSLIEYKIMKNELNNDLLEHLYLQNLEL